MIYLVSSDREQKILSNVKFNHFRRLSEGSELLILGVEGGGTSTVAAVVNESKELMGAGISGPCRYHEVGVEVARDNLIEAIKTASPDMDGMLSMPFEHGVFGMGGLDSDVDREVIEGFVRSTGVARNYLIVNDVVVAFYAATLGSPGVVVNSGTGSIMYGSDGEYESGLVGGWGCLIGDEGSAPYIAKRALQETSKIFDGRRGGATSLKGRAMDYFEIEDLRDIISKSSAKDLDLKHFSGFSEIVSQEADKGDQVAKEILKEASIELAKGAEATAKRLSLPENFIVGCTGSVFKSRLLFRDFKREIKLRFPHIWVEAPVFYPVVGALAMGLEKAGIKMYDGEAKKLEREIVLELKN